MLNPLQASGEYIFVTGSRFLKQIQVSEYTSLTVSIISYLILSN